MLWPVQQLPEKVVRIENTALSSEQNLAHSLTGLGAHRANTDAHNELTWIIACLRDEKLNEASQLKLSISICEVLQNGLWESLLNQAEPLVVNELADEPEKCIRLAPIIIYGIRNIGFA